MMSHLLECMECGYGSNDNNPVTVCPICEGLIEYRLIIDKVKFNGPLTFWGTGRSYLKYPEL